MKKIVALILASLLMIQLCACGSPTMTGSAAPSDPAAVSSEPSGNGEVMNSDLHLGCIVFSLSDAVPVYQAKTLQAYCDMFGIKLTVVAASGAEENLEAVENLLAAGVDGIFIHTSTGVESWMPLLEERGVPIVLGNGLVTSESGLAAIENASMFLGQINYDDYAVVETLIMAAVESGATNIGFNSPSQVTPNSLGDRKRFFLEIVEKYNAENNNALTIYEGTGNATYDFAGFASSMIASHGNILDCIITVTTGDSTYQPLLLAEMEGKIDLYAATVTDMASAAFESNTLKLYCAGCEYAAAEFMIMYNYLTGNPLKTDGYITLTAAPFFIDSLENQLLLEENYYAKDAPYPKEFLLTIDSLERLEAMASAATFERIMDGTFTDI